MIDTNPQFGNSNFADGENILNLLQKKTSQPVKSTRKVAQCH